MQGNSTYKDVAKWRDQWMLIMSPNSASFQIPALNPDSRTPAFIKQARLRQHLREIPHSGSQEPRQSGYTVVNQLSCDSEQTVIETDIWED